MKTELHPRIITLDPMHVASFCVVGKDPEIKAFKLMSEWATKAGLMDNDGTRYFGFDNPAPSSDRDEYGYEVWASPGIENADFDAVNVKEFAGGMYAVTRTSLTNIGQTWRELIAWREGSKYGEGKHQCLEEHLSLPIGRSFNEIEIDLYLPIAD